MKLLVIVTICFVVHVIQDDVFAEETQIRSVELTSVLGNPKRIRSLYNSSWSVVGKCCPVGQTLHKEIFEGTNNTGSQCRDPLPEERIEFAPVFNRFNESGIYKPGVTMSQFVAIVGNPCKYGMFMLDPETEAADEFYLLANGSIYTPMSSPKILEPGSDYCMEFVPGMDLTVVVCYHSELKVVTADARSAFYAVGLLTSVPFLLATILAYSITPRLRDVYGLALCCYSGCLAVAFLSLAILQLGGQCFDDYDCNHIAFVIQFSFVACFSWLSAMIVEMLLLIRRYGDIRSAIREERPNSGTCFFYYSLWAWGLPAILIVVSLIKDLQPVIPWSYVKRSGEDLPSCWFEPHKLALSYFYGPTGLLVFGNAVVFVIAGVKMAKTQRKLDRMRLSRNEESDRDDRRVFKELRLIFIVTMVLFLIMGVNLAMELVSVLTDSDLLAWSIFDLVNALQGVLVFGLFVLRKPARTLVWCRMKELFSNRNRESNDEKNHEMTLLPLSNNKSIQSSKLNQ